MRGWRGAVGRVGGGRCGCFSGGSCRWQSTRAGMPPWRWSLDVTVTAGDSVARDSGRL